MPKFNRRGDLTASGSWGGADASHPTWRAVTVSSPLPVLLVLIPYKPSQQRLLRPDNQLTVYSGQNGREDVFDCNIRDFVDKLRRDRNRGVLPIVMFVCMSEAIDGHYETFLPRCDTAIDPCPIHARSTPHPRPIHAWSTPDPRPIHTVCAQIIAPRWRTGPEDGRLQTIP